MALKSCGRIRARGRGGEGERGHRVMRGRSRGEGGEEDEEEKRRTREQDLLPLILQGEFLCVFSWALHACWSAWKQLGGEGREEAAGWRLGAPSFERSMTQAKSSFSIDPDPRWPLSFVIRTSPSSAIDLWSFTGADLSSRWFWRTVGWFTLPSE